VLVHLWNGGSGAAAGSAAWLLTRCVMAALTALLVTILLGRKLIPWLRSREVLERVEKTDSPELRVLHSGKQGTPTMGGLVFLPAAVFATALFARWDVPQVALCVAVLLAFGWIGYRDDRVKLLCPDRAGFGKRYKLRLQTTVALMAVLVLWFLVRREDPDAGALAIPFVRSRALDLGILWGIPFLAFAVFLLTGSTNAVNLSDGLDGLAAGCSALAFLAFAAVGLVVGSTDLAARVATPLVPGAGEVAVFAASIAGACIGFLRFNRFPARVFMGNTGALALGGGLGITALSVRREILLAIAGGIFVIEALSVILQVFSFRCFRRRILRCAPIHHHFQFGGWPERKVTSRFWLVGAILAVVSVISLTLG